MNLNTFGITAVAMAILMGSSLEYSRNVKPLLAIDRLHSMTVLMGASLAVSLFSLIHLAGNGLRPAYRSLSWRTALGVVFFDLGTDSLNALALILPLSLTAHSIIGESQIIFSFIFGYCLRSTRFKASDIIGAGLSCAGVLFYAYNKAKLAGQTTDAGESQGRVGLMLLGVGLVLASKAAKELSVYFESKAMRTEGTPEEAVMLLTHMLGAPLALGFFAWAGTDPWSITSTDSQGALLGHLALTSVCMLIHMRAKMWTHKLEVSSLAYAMLDNVKLVVKVAIFQSFSTWPLHLYVAMAFTMAGVAIKAFGEVGATPAADHQFVAAQTQAGGARRKQE